jgi:hypothetical protein
MTQRTALDSASPAWLLLLGLVLAVAGYTLEPSWALGQDEGTQTPNVRYLPSNSGGTADSNRTMIAVTGVDVTGASILYLVDTENRQLAVYQGAGGGGSTQGVKFVGARNISLDMRLDGFNDKTESNGKPLGFKDLEKLFSGQGIEVDENR